MKSKFRNYLDHIPISKHHRHPTFNSLVHHKSTTQPPLTPKFHHTSQRTNLSSINNPVINSLIITSTPHTHEQPHNPKLIDTQPNLANLIFHVSLAQKLNFAARESPNRAVNVAAARRVSNRICLNFVCVPSPMPIIRYNIKSSRAAVSEAILKRECDDDSRLFTLLESSSNPQRNEPSLERGMTGCVVVVGGGVCNPPKGSCVIFGIFFSAVVMVTARETLCVRVKMDENEKFCVK
jgi:hypothetical protein